MQKKFFKTAAVIALLGFISLTVPTLSSAETKASKINFRLLIKKPVAWISSFVSVFTPIFGTKNSTTVTPDNSSSTIKPTGGLAAPRAGGGD